jgi:hypothetical protein
MRSLGSCDDRGCRNHNLLLRRCKKIKTKDHPHVASSHFQAAYRDCIWAIQPSLWTAKSSLQLGCFERVAFDDWTGGRKRCAASGACVGSGARAPLCACVLKRYISRTISLSGPVAVCGQNPVRWDCIRNCRTWETTDMGTCMNARATSFSFQDGPRVRKRHLACYPSRKNLEGSD